MSAKIAKTLARQKEKVAEGQYYEAHQQLRVITSRYLKSADYDSAADVLHKGALLLLGAGQGGSGGDLARMLINDVYDKGAMPVDKQNKDRAVEILRAFPADEPTRKRYITEMMGWSSKLGESERGDPELHHEVGVLYASEPEPYEAEKHLLLGVSRPSASTLATMHYRWYTLDSPHTAALYASRSVLPYLILGNLQAATVALSTFTYNLTTNQPSLPVQSIDSSRSSARIFPSLPLLNYLTLLLLACQKADAALYRQLTRHYTPHLQDVGEMWSDMLANIGEIWFGIRLPRQGGNPLFDMMGSMLFGGGQGGAGAGAGAGAGGARGGQKKVGGGTGSGPPVAMDLD